MRRLRLSFHAYLKDEEGALLVEFMILLPMMIWAFVALVVYWDVFKTINVSQKAAYSIADLLSRQVIVTEDFLDGMEDVMDFLTPGVGDSRVRITSLRFEANNLAVTTDDVYEIIFTHSSDTTLAPEYTSVNVQNLKPLIPIMDNQDSVIIVETWVDFTPDFDIGVLNMAPGLGDQTFTQFIVTRPRSREVCLDGTAGCV
ncbi:MAG: hypothetical protein JNN02_02590 [Tabrizicola sp.]|nr:hypothetical protein [Tabrizicola sp.]